MGNIARNKRIKSIIVTLITLVCLLLGYRLGDTYLVGKAEVEGTSMVPSYHDKDEGIFSKIANPQRNDVVIFMMGDTPIIKRLIAVEGDTIEARRGSIYLNGKKLDEPYIVESWSNGGCIENNPITLKKDEFFLLGDNRNVSHDSRAEGVFTRDQYIGTMIFNTKLSPESTIKDQLQ